MLYGVPLTYFILGPVCKSKKVNKSDWIYCFFICKYTSFPANTWPSMACLEILELVFSNHDDRNILTDTAYINC